MAARRAHAYVLEACDGVPQATRKILATERMARVTTRMAVGTVRMGRVCVRTFTALRTTQTAENEAENVEMHRVKLRARNSPDMPEVERPEHRWKRVSAGDNNMYTPWTAPVKVQVICAFVGRSTRNSTWSGSIHRDWSYHIRRRDRTLGQSGRGWRRVDGGTAGNGNR